eukprot:gene5400-5623_t
MPGWQASWRSFRQTCESKNKKLVAILQQYITITLYQQQALPQGVQSATRALGMLDEANNISEVLPFADFYNDAVNSEEFNIKDDFRRAMRASFSFCSYSFVTVPATGKDIADGESDIPIQRTSGGTVQMENQKSQFSELQGALFSRGPTWSRPPFIQLNRAKDSGSLRKPLKVKFVGEEGVDEGGVQKEFFQLLVLYKKLMGQPPAFDDLRELHPEVHQSLQKLLAHEEDVESFGLFFQ